jgi:pimeloyl-ACP methyl ester carboxylesterase
MQDGSFAPRAISDGTNRIVVPVLWAADDYPSNYFGALIPADGYRFHGLKQPTLIAGWGETLVGVRTNAQLMPEEIYYPPEGIVRPLNALLEFPVQPGDFGPPRLVISEPGRRPPSMGAGGPLDLAFNYTAAYGVLLSHARLRGLGVRAYLHRAAFDREAGIFMLEPYQPDKIPVLMVHGLISTPLAWRELSNELWCDPEIRDHFQIWHYFYPTTYPYLHSSSVLRDNLRDLEGLLDPNGKSAALRNIVIVAHSMGGLLARPLVTDSGDALWTNAFTRAPEQLHGAADELATLRHYFFFKPEPSVRRVIFMATPHRGSDFAATIAGRLGRSLADTDPEFDDFFAAVAAKNTNAFTPTILRWSRQHRLNAVQVLLPENPVLRALAVRPFAPGVHIHSIIGRRGSATGTNSSDGLVSYRSAHLDAAESELVVPSGHAVFRNPAAIAEVKRILREHWKNFSAAHPSPTLPTLPTQP